MNKKDFRIKKMSLNELRLAIDWAAEEGWNPGLYDAEAYYAADPDGYLMGFLDGEPIASISVVKYNSDFGFLGFYIVKPKYRGKGFGWKIWQAGMEYLKDCNAALDGVVDQQENYKKSGFKLAYRNIRFAGKPIDSRSEHHSVIPLKDIGFEKIAEFEKDFFPVDRNEFLKKWIDLPESFSYGIVEEGKLKAYTVLRKCRNGYKIAPLFAQNVAQAESLLTKLSQHAGKDEDLYIDVPEINENAVNWIKSKNYQMVFETARMYTGDFPELAIDQIFGVTSFEIG